MNRIGLALSGGGFRATLYHLEHDPFFCATLAFCPK